MKVVIYTTKDRAGADLVLFSDDRAYTAPGWDVWSASDSREAPDLLIKASSVERRAKIRLS